MRIWTTVALVAVAAAPAIADPGPKVALSPDEVAATLRPVADAIEHCYMDRTPDVRGAGHLDLVLEVTRLGLLQKVDVKTPGLAVKTSKAISECIHATLYDVTFPSCKTYTTATVPYFFQRTAAPNSGPQYSCWDPNGCHASREVHHGASTAAWTAAATTAANRVRTASSN